MMSRVRNIAIALLLSTLLLISACSPQPPSRFEQAQQESTQRGASAVVKESASGGKFNAFFPSAGGGYERVYTQEKKGFAQAKLKKEGTELAVMSISDTLNNPTAATSFQDSPMKVKGYPAIKKGSTSTAVLVADRYQVKISSRDSAFTEIDRLKWLEKFDLKGLAKLN